MAKIDTTLIEGFENLTDEEKVAALLNVEFEDNSKEVERLKKVNDKLSSENADKKRQLRSYQSEEEVRKQQQEEELKAMQEELENLKTDKKVADTKSSLLGLGFDEKLATLIAPTLKNVSEEDRDVLFDGFKQFSSNQENKIKLDLVKGTTVPKTNNSGNTITKEDFKKMTLKDKVKFKEEHPEDYANLYK